MTALLSNIDATEMVAACYDEPADLTGTVAEHPIRLHYKERDGVLYIVPEGSRTPADWRGDFEAWLRRDHEKINHPSLGLVHSDFLASSLSVLDQVKQRINGQPFCIAGHSRGGSQAGVLGGLLADDGIVPLKLYLIEPARTFFPWLPSIFDRFPTWGCWNGNDPVPFAPLAWAQFKLQIIGTPMLNPGDCHHIANVIAALKIANNAA